MNRASDVRGKALEFAATLRLLETETGRLDEAMEAADFDQAADAARELRWLLRAAKRLARLPRRPLEQHRLLMVRARAESILAIAPELALSEPAEVGAPPGRWLADELAWRLARGALAKPRPTSAARPRPTWRGVEALSARDEVDECPADAPPRPSAQARRFATLILADLAKLRDLQSLVSVAADDEATAPRAPRRQPPRVGGLRPLPRGMRFAARSWRRRRGAR